MLKVKTKTKKFEERNLNEELHYSKVIYGRYHGRNIAKNRKKEMHMLWLNDKSLYFRFSLKKFL